MWVWERHRERSLAWLGAFAVSVRDDGSAFVAGNNGVIYRRD